MAEPRSPSAQGALVFQDHWERVKKEIEQELAALVNHLTGLIQKNAPVATNALAGSFEPISEFSPMRAFIGVGSPLWFGAGGYGEYVELGTKPHWAPLEPLARWVEQKIQPHVLAVGIQYYKTGKRKGKTKPVKEGSMVLEGDARRRAIYALARAIQIKIAEKGTEGKLFVKRSLDELGLQSQLVDGGTDGESYYSIDIAAWLEGRLPAILERVTV